MLKMLLKFALPVMIGLLILMTSISAPAENNTAIPLINPLGDLEAYLNVEYYSPADLDEPWVVEFYNLEDEGVELRFWGETWILEVPARDSKEPFQELKEYITQSGGSLYTRSEETLVFNLPGTDGEMWWAVADYPGESYNLMIIREKCLLPGKTLTYLPEEDDQVFHFASYHSGENYQVLKLDLPNGQLELRGTGIYTTGEYQRTLDYLKDINADGVKVNYLTDTPQQQGRIFWTVSLYQDNPPRKISFSLECLETTARLPVVKNGSKLGLLRVRGAAFGEVSVRPANNIDIFHPELNDEAFLGKFNSAGEADFWLPAGLWDLKVRPTNYSTLEACIAGFIPVNAGEMTVVELPATLTYAYSYRPETEFYQNEGAIKLLYAGENDGEAVVYFTLQDEEVRGITPTLENTDLFEGGRQVKINEIGPVKTPAEIVLLLDSSGSMKGQMEETISTARQFIGSLPDNTFIQVVDFDTAPSCIPGTTREEVMESITNIKADGATALYDSVLEGLNLLADKTRPILLVFTDGVDANFDDSGPGSQAGLSEVLEAVRQANIPLVTIGFGSGHDQKVLQELAQVSGGSYYPAADKNALEKVFTSIQKIFGHTYQLTYQRPEQVCFANNPLISIVVDTNVLMDFSAEGEENSYRLQKIKNMLYDFILGLPEESLIQLQNFDSNSSIAQIMTSGKAEILKAIGELETTGGTNNLDSLQVAFGTLNLFPLERKVFIFITDAALDVKGGIEKYQDILKQIKEKNIKSSWVGLGLTEEQDLFAQIAEISGGQYITAEEPDDLRTVFTNLTCAINEEAVSTERIVLHLFIANQGDEGEVNYYTDNKRVSFSRPVQTDMLRLPIGVYYQTGLPIDGE